MGVRADRIQTVLVQRANRPQRTHIPPIHPRPWNPSWARQYLLPPTSPSRGVRDQPPEWTRRQRPAQRPALLLAAHEPVSPATMSPACIVHRATIRCPPRRATDEPKVQDGLAASDRQPAAQSPASGAERQLEGFGGGGREQVAQRTVCTSARYLI